LFKLWKYGFPVGAQALWSLERVEGVHHKPVASRFFDKRLTSWLDGKVLVCKITGFPWRRVKLCKSCFAYQAYNIQAIKTNYSAVRISLIKSVKTFGETWALRFG